MQFTVTKHRSSGKDETTLVDNYQTAAILASQTRKYEGCRVTVERVAQSWRTIG